MFLEQAFPIFEDAVLLHEVLHASVFIPHNGGYLFNQKLLLAPRAHCLFLLYYLLVGAFAPETAGKGIVLEKRRG